MPCHELQQASHVVHYISDTTPYSIMIKLSIPTYMHTHLHIVSYHAISCRPMFFTTPSRWSCSKAWSSVEAFFHTTCPFSFVCFFLLYIFNVRFKRSFRFCDCHMYTHVHARIHRIIPRRVTSPPHRLPPSGCVRKQCLKRCDQTPAGRHAEAREHAHRRAQTRGKTILARHGSVLQLGFCANMLQVAMMF